MSERVYGTITIQDKNWVIEAEPQVIVKLKRMFPNAKQRRSKKLWLSMTPENGMEIEWALTRWPMQIAPDVKESLLVKKESYETMRENVMNILSGKTVLHANRVPKRDPRPYQQQAADLAYTSKTLLLTDDLGLGKGQPPETPILTPTGWKTYKEIKVGDYVVGSNGRGTKVTGVFPKGVQQLYRVTFSDKTSTITDGEHLWQVQNNIRQNKGNVNNHLILSTQEMYEGKRKTVRIKSGAGYKMERDYSFDSYYLYKNNGSKWSIPQVSPVIYRKQKPLPLDPYILGAILGDGSTTGELSPSKQVILK